MEFPERFAALPEYAFPRLRRLLDGHTPGGAPVAMSIGEPQHPFPGWISDALADAVPEFNRYPPNDGSADLLRANADWVLRRYGVSLEADTQLLALNGTREGLFNGALALCPERKMGGQPNVLIPNPFYQVYAVGAAAAGAKVVYVPATTETGFLPDFAGLDAATLDRTAIAYICSPSNPQGAVASEDYLETLIGLAEKHDFRVFADECYSEIYRGDPPPGALQVAARMGADPNRVLAFHSLSKRSSMPGLRSGFVAGGADAIARMKQLRAYAGAPLPGPLQAVATRVWADEAHVEENRRLYAAKFELAQQILGDLPGVSVPVAGFFLWLPVPDGEAATVKLWTETGIRALPGAYLGRDDGAGNPGAQFIRVALVAPETEIAPALTALRACLFD